jgi:hypothetical protein
LVAVSVTVTGLVVVVSRGDGRSCGLFVVADVAAADKSACASVINRVDGDGAADEGVVAGKVLEELLLDLVGDCAAGVGGHHVDVTAARVLVRVHTAQAVELRERVELIADVVADGATKAAEGAAILVELESNLFVGLQTGEVDADHGGLAWDLSELESIVIVDLASSVLGSLVRDDLVSDLGRRVLLLGAVPGRLVNIIIIIIVIMVVDILPRVVRRSRMSVLHLLLMAVVLVLTVISTGRVVS